MRRVLFGGGSHAELPMIEEAKKAGWYVITTGTNRDGLGHQYADEYVYGDFSDKEFILNLAKEKKVEAIVSGCNDFSYISTAYACEQLGFKGHVSYETSMIIHQKDRFRKMTRSIGITTPKYCECYDIDTIDSLLTEMKYPVLVKPIDLTGGKGIKVCYSNEEVRTAAIDAFCLTRQDHIIIEEFIFGTNHGASFLLKDQKVIYSIFDDEQYGLNKYLVLGACSPSTDLKDSSKKQLIEDVNKIAKHLQLVDGLFHTQFILKENGEIVIIDPCLRAPGDLYVLLAKYVTGVNYPKEIFNAETGEGVNDSYVVEDNIVARECIMTYRTGIISSIYIDDYIKEHIVHSLIWAKPGDCVEDIMKYKAGILIMKFDRYEDMKNVLAQYPLLVKIEFEE